MTPQAWALLELALLASLFAIWSLGLWVVASRRGVAREREKARRVLANVLARQEEELGAGRRRAELNAELLAHLTAGERHLDCTTEYCSGAIVAGSEAEDQRTLGRVLEELRQEGGRP